MFSEFIGPKRPLSWALQFWPVLVLSLLCAFAATYLVKKIALKFGIVDKPDDTVKTHKEPVAYLGGVAMLVGLTAGVLAGIYCLRDYEHFRPAMKWLFGILAGAAIACFVGLLDDIFNLSPAKKMLGQVIAAVALLAVGIRPALHYFADPFGWQMSQQLEITLGTLVVVFFVLGATNSLNLLDGLDGLCAGVTAIIALGMLLLAVHLSTWEFSDVGDPVRIIVCLGLVGGVCGFLPFNRHPAKIFMGDSGAMFLGLLLSASAITLTGQIDVNALSNQNSRSTFVPLILPFTVLAIPLLDLGMAIVRRLRAGRSPFAADRSFVFREDELYI